MHHQRERQLDRSDGSEYEEQQKACMEMAQTENPVPGGIPGVGEQASQHHAAEQAGEADAEIDMYQWCPS